MEKPSVGPLIRRDQGPGTNHRRPARDQSQESCQGRGNVRSSCWAAEWSEVLKTCFQRSEHGTCKDDVMFNGSLNVLSSLNGSGVFALGSH